MGIAFLDLELMTVLLSEEDELGGVDTALRGERMVDLSTDLSKFCLDLSLLDVGVAATVGVEKECGKIEPSSGVEKSIKFIDGISDTALSLLSSVGSKVLSFISGDCWHEAYVVSVLLSILDDTF